MRQQYLRQMYLSKVQLRQQLMASFAKGVGSTLSIRATEVPIKRDACVVDTTAIAGDWRRVGNQIRSAERRMR